MSRSRTARTALRHEIFGNPAELPNMRLPTYMDVMRCFLHERMVFMDEYGQGYPSNREISNLVAVKVIHVWEKASIPTIVKKTVLDKIESYYNQAADALKPKSLQKRNKQTATSYEESISAMKIFASNTLFDICSCKCPRLAEGICECSKERKVPEKERRFLLDQRTQRKMAIGSVDEITTQQNLRRIERESQRAASRAKQCMDESTPSSSYQYEENVRADVTSSSTPPSNDDDGDSGDEVYLDQEARMSKSLMTKSLPNFATAAHRTGVSSRKAALLASALLEDFGNISEENKTLVIDRFKVEREKTKIGKKIQQEDAEKSSSAIALFFDGRKDSTLVNEKIGSIYHRKTITENHYSLVEEPGSTYFGHTSPPSGHGSSIASSIEEFVKKYNRSLEGYFALGSDGTNTNTRWEKGAIPLLEQAAGKAYQWLISLLHANELALKHLIIQVDGKTSRPTGFSGPIGKPLANCQEKLSKTKRGIKFSPIHAPWTENVDVEVNDLSEDQRYLLEICRAVSSGYCDPPLLHREPGLLSHARFLTTANKILLLYIGTATPEKSLITLVEFIMKVYAPSWFLIKKKIIVHRRR